MNSCHEEGVCDRNRAGIEAAHGSFDSSSIPDANTLLVSEMALSGVLSEACQRAPRKRCKGGQINFETSICFGKKSKGALQ
eukprot:gene12202-biopygen3333